MIETVLPADLSAPDDDGYGVSHLSEVAKPEMVNPGAYLVAGNATSRSVVRVVSVGDDGHVRFSIVPGSLHKNNHLLHLNVVPRRKPAPVVVEADAAPADAPDL